MFQNIEAARKTCILTSFREYQQSWTRHYIWILCQYYTFQLGKLVTFLTHLYKIPFITHKFISLIKIHILFTQKSKRGIDESAPLSFGDSFLMRRLSFTLRWKLLRDRSRPMILKSEYVAACEVDVEWMFTAVGFCLFLDAPPLKGCIFRCSDQRI